MLLRVLYKILYCGIVFLLTPPQNGKLSEGRDQIYLFSFIALGYGTMSGV